MPNYKRVARRKAKKYGLDPGVFVRQIQQESGFNPTISSPAGAQGIAQIMPATAKGWGVNPLKPREALDAAAKNMASYVMKYGSYENALRAYNAGPGAIQASKGYSETNNYVKTILGGKDPGKLGAPKSDAAKIADRQKVESSTSSSTSDPSDGQYRKLALLSYLENRDKPTALLDLGAALKAQPVDTATTTTVTKTNGVAAPKRNGHKTSSVSGARLSVAPGANRAGVDLKPVLKNFVKTVSAQSGRPYTITTGTNHNQMTTSGNVSDHWDGHGADLAVPDDSRKGDLLAAHAISATGVPFKKALQMAKKGGLYNLDYNGHRVQVIWKTMEGGNHHNHVHIGIR